MSRVVCALFLILALTAARAEGQPTPRPISEEDVKKLAERDPERGWKLHQEFMEKEEKEREEGRKASLDFHRALVT
jgi:hypothetical protein